MAKNTALTPTAQANSASFFLFVPASIACRRDLTKSSKLLFGTLNARAKRRKSDVCRARQEDLCEEIGVHRSTLIRSLYQLKGSPDKEGRPTTTPLISIVRTGRSSWYRILPLEGGKRRPGSSIDPGPIPVHQAEPIPLLTAESPKTPSEPLTAPDTPDTFESAGNDTEPQETPAMPEQDAIDAPADKEAPLQAADVNNLTKHEGTMSHFARIHREEGSGSGIRKNLKRTMPADAPERQNTPNGKKESTEQRGFELLDTAEGRALVALICLIGFDWHVQNPELTTLHRKNRQRKNRRDVALFAGRYGLNALAWAVDKCERTSLADGAAVLRHMLTGGLFANERRRLERHRAAA